MIFFLTVTAIAAVVAIAALWRYFKLMEEDWLIYKREDRRRDPTHCPNCREDTLEDLWVRNYYGAPIAKPTGPGNIPGAYYLDKTTVLCGVCGFEGSQEQYGLTDAEMKALPAPDETDQVAERILSRPDST